MSGFSRLLLEEDETYLEDHGAHYQRPAGTVAGRVFLTTRSLFFVPSVPSVKVPVVRITLAKVVQMGRDGRDGAPSLHSAPLARNVCSPLSPQASASCYAAPTPR